jgi:hypothetical protein
MTPKSRSTETVDGTKFMRETQTEAQWQESVVAEMRLRGWLVYHSWSSVHSEAGFPDVCAVRAGVLLFIEFKREVGGVESDAQRCWGEALENVQKSITAAVESVAGPAKARDVLVRMMRNVKPSDVAELTRVIT